MDEWNGKVSHSEAEGKLHSVFNVGQLVTDLGYGGFESNTYFFIIIIFIIKRFGFSEYRRQDNGSSHQNDRNQTSEYIGICSDGNE